MADERQDATREHALALVTQAAIQRRKEAEPQILQAKPDSIVDVRSSQVNYGFHPRALPYKLAHFQTLRETLEKEYQLRFEVPQEVPDLLRKLARPAAPQKKRADNVPAFDLDIDEIGEYLFRMEHPVARFSGGRIDITKRSLVEVADVTFSYENISVTVSDTTDVAELLIKDLVQYLWASADADRSWGDLSAHLQTKTFGTSTRVKLGFPPSALLNHAFCEFIDTDVVAGSRYGRFMGSRSDRDQFAPPGDSEESWYFDELHIRVSRYDRTSRTHGSQRFRIGVGRKDYQGTDIVDIDSVLAFDEHCKFIEKLIAHVKSRLT